MPEDVFIMPFWAGRRAKMPKKLELSGKKFNSLTVTGPAEGTRDGYRCWVCRCECGNTVVASSRQLVKGIITDCGCRAKKYPAKRGQTREDLTGRVFGRLTVLHEAPNKNGRTAWECQCECGNTCVVVSSQLKNGAVTSCGCARKEYDHNRQDVTGQRFGRLTAIKPTEKRDYKGSVIWLCRCDCGNETEVSLDGLKQGNYTSCGCKKKEITENIGSTLTFVDGTCVEWLKNRKHRSDNTTGFRGVSLSRKGGYRVSIGFKGKRYHLGIFEEFDDAVEKRKEAERVIHDAFIQAQEKWEKQAAKDPVWAEKNPLYFDVKKTGSILEVISNDPEFDGNRIVAGEKAFVFKQTPNVLPVISSYMSEASQIKPE